MRRVVPVSIMLVPKTVLNFPALELRGIDCVIVFLPVVSISRSISFRPIGSVILRAESSRLSLCRVAQFRRSVFVRRTDVGERGQQIPMSFHVIGFQLSVCE